MFISSLSSSDPRFKTLSFGAGLNILVADRTESSDQGDSRNSIGKTSAVKILRYLLGGDLPAEFRAPELADHKFTAVLHLPSAGAGLDQATVTRAVSPTTRLKVEGWSVLEAREDIYVDDWRRLMAEHVFHIPNESARPTPGQLWGQLIRLFFNNPTKTHQSEADWESGIRIGYLLGLSPEVLGRAGDLDRLDKQDKAVRAAIKEGAMPHLSLDEPALRAQIAAARRQRDRIQESLASFRVDDQYAAHQQQADDLTATIQLLNDEALVLQRRVRELRAALDDEVDPAESVELASKLARVYGEVGLVLPESVGRRFDEVAAFHRSVVRNRRTFLEQELGSAVARMTAVEEQRSSLDGARADVLRLLGETVALDTFMSTQRTLAGHEATVADLEKRLEAAVSVSAISDRIKVGTAELVAAVRTELHDRDDQLDEAIALFGALGSEIYTDREASLLVAPSPRGLLSVRPQVSGDASTGVRSVETFMLDMVCLISGMQASRAPGLLVHDSTLFDAIDGRQVASCLNIGARLADEHGFQYVVTLNSDFLESVQLQSEGAFDAEPYILQTRLTDASASGGLFGFRFD